MRTSIYSVGRILKFKRSLIFLQPSLPTPTFFAHLLFLPPIYCFTRQLAPLPEVEFICIFRSLEDPICQNVNLNVDRAFVLVSYECAYYVQLFFLTCSAPRRYGQGPQQLVFKKQQLRDSKGKALCYCQP